MNNSLTESMLPISNWKRIYTRLDTKEKSVQLAHENYEVVHSRYLNGLSLVTDMLMPATYS